MNVFELRDRLVSDYASYTRSFIKIADPRISDKVDSTLNAGAFWPDPLLQLNPTFLPGGTIDDLVERGILHPECARIFRIDKTDTDHTGKPLLLHTHQKEAILKANEEKKSYVLTTGTGSGKSLAYMVPIIDHVLRKTNTERDGHISAIVVYPMNALCNSQMEELTKFLISGYGRGHEPVRFARYTGQETSEERKALADAPPDILLTNFMMLELVMTRPTDVDRKVVRAAQGLNFLVLDELHTYRGRQGADVAMLVRRVKQRMHASGLQFVGTSATIAGEGDRQQSRFRCINGFRSPRFRRRSYR